MNKILQFYDYDKALAYFKDQLLHIHQANVKRSGFKVIAKPVLLLTVLKAIDDEAITVNRFDYDQFEPRYTALFRQYFMQARQESLTPMFYPWYFMSHDDFWHLSWQGRANPNRVALRCLHPPQHYSRLLLRRPVDPRQPSYLPPPAHGVPHQRENHCTSPCSRRKYSCRVRPLAQDLAHDADGDISFRYRKWQISFLRHDVTFIFCLFNNFHQSLTLSCCRKTCTFNIFSNAFDKTTIAIR